MLYKIISFFKKSNNESKILNFFLYNYENSNYFSKFIKPKGALFLNDQDYSINYKNKFNQRKYSFYKNFLYNFSSDIKIISVDGAFKNLLKNNIKIDFLIGDLDHNHKKNIFEIKSIKNIIHEPSQDLCDFEKSILYIKKNDIFPLFIFGINGGSFDRILHNMNIFNNILGVMNIGICYNMIFFNIYKDESIEWNNLFIQNNTRISILSINSKTKIETKGLKWDLNNQSDFSHSISISNMVENKNYSKNELLEIKIKIIDGDYITIFIYY